MIKKLIAQVKKLKVGNPHDEKTYISVMARIDLADKLKDQLDDALQKGAQLQYGGKKDGTYFEPTILSHCKGDMKVMREETFGPLLALQTFSTEKEVIDKVNASHYALGCSIFTEDNKTLQNMIQEIREPAIFVNELVKSDPRLPFGGFKNSGYGRELGEEGICEFSLIQTVYKK